VSPSTGATTEPSGSVVKSGGRCHTSFGRAAPRTVGGPVVWCFCAWQIRQSPAHRRRTVFCRTGDIAEKRHRKRREEY
jgi:hypothetical protein